MNIDLVREYEPVLRFNKGEHFFPMTVQEYLPHCSLHGLAAGQGVMRIPPPYVDADTLPLFSSKEYYLVYANRRVADEQEAAALRQWIEQQRTKRLDLPKFFREIKDKVVELGLDLQKIFLPLNLPHDVFDRALANYGGLPQHQPVYYYRVTEDSGYTAIQYWFFYAYNDFATSFDGVNDHEGDWESIYLFFKDNRPVWATYASHIGEGKDLGRPWDPQALELEGTHPVVYVGGGSHASYHTREAHLPDKAFVPGDVVIGGSDGLKWSDPVLLDQSWCIDYGGRWGAYQWDNPVHKMADAGGGPPTGPKFRRDGSLRPQWDHPVAFAGLT
jgi:hypothetical protein